MLDKWKYLNSILIVELICPGENRYFIQKFIYRHKSFLYIYFFRFDFKMKIKTKKEINQINFVTKF